MCVPVWELRNNNSRLYPSSFKLDQEMNCGTGESGKVGSDFGMVNVRSNGFILEHGKRD